MGVPALGMKLPAVERSVSAAGMEGAPRVLRVNRNGSGGYSQSVLGISTHSVCTLYSSGVSGVRGMTADNGNSDDVDV